MKRVFSIVALSLFALIGFSCSNEDGSGVTEGDVVNISIIAEQTRTHLNNDGTQAEWDTTGEYLMVYQTADGTTERSQSSEAEVSNGLARFGVSFPKVATALSYEYNAIYPAKSVAADATPTTDDVVVTLPVEQRPSASSYDSSADLLVARSIVGDNQPESLNMAFKRLVAMGRLSFAGIDDMMISRVEITIPGAHLAGAISVNLPESRIAEYSNTSESIALSYDTPIAAADAFAYFTLLPVELTEGDSFTVTVYGDSGSVSREVTLGEGSSLSFVIGDMTIFKVNMQSTPEAITFADIAGTWRLKEWCGKQKSEFSFDVYLDIDAQGGVTLWQRLSEYGWEMFESEAVLADGVISGRYSDGTDWSADYSIAEGNDGSMTWSSTTDATDVSVYERAELPAGIEERDTRSPNFGSPIL